jgi:hypothetical protein
MATEPVEETVTELLRIARDLLADERTRGQTLDAKTATLAGFAGTILALIGTLAASLFRLELGRLGEPMVRAVLLLSVLWRSGRRSRWPAS